MIIRNIFWVLVIFIFMLTFYLGYLSYNHKFSSRSKRIELRKDFLGRIISTQHIPMMALKHRLFSKNHRVNLIFSKFQIIYAIDNFLLHSGYDLRIDQVLKILGLLFLFVFIATLAFTGSFFKSLFLGCLSQLIPIAIVKVKNAKRQKLIEIQLPEVIDHMTRSLRAGHSFGSTIQSAAADSPNPIGLEFKIVVDQLSVGISMRDAMNNLIRRLDSEDVRFFALAVAINQEVGGNLSELLGEVSQMMRARSALKLSIKALASEGNAGAIVLGLMPPIIAGGISLINPHYYAPLYESSIGSTILISTIGIVMIGFIWMKRIADIQL